MTINVFQIILTTSSHHLGYSGFTIDISVGLNHSRKCSTAHFFTSLNEVTTDFITPRDAASRTDCIPVISLNIKSQNDETNITRTSLSDNQPLLFFIKHTSINLNLLVIHSSRCICPWQSFHYTRTAAHEVMIMGTCVHLVSSCASYNNLSSTLHMLHSL